MRYAIPNYVERNSTHRILTIPLQSLDNRSDMQIARMAHGCVLWRFKNLVTSPNREARDLSRRMINTTCYTRTDVFCSCCTIGIRHNMDLRIKNHGLSFPAPSVVDARRVNRSSAYNRYTDYHVNIYNINTSPMLETCIYIYKLVILRGE